MVLLMRMLGSLSCVFVFDNKDKIYMKRWMVSVPIAGVVYVEVEADTKEEAIDLAVALFFSLVSSLIPRAFTMSVLAVRASLTFCISTTFITRIAVFSISNSCAG